MVSRCISEASKMSSWHYNSKYAKVRESGAGNNWAFGFDCAISINNVFYLYSPCSRYQRLGKEMTAFTIEMARTQIEECDLFDGFLVLHSLAGGTGSGVGMYIVFCISLPKTTIMQELISQKYFMTNFLDH